MLVLLFDRGATLADAEKPALGETATHADISPSGARRKPSSTCYRWSASYSDMVSTKRQRAVLVQVEKMWPFSAAELVTPVNVIVVLSDSVIVVEPPEVVALAIAAPAAPPP